ncbi:MAG: alpha/beta hydrolase [Opitutaceae bacterium]|nr:alpha/beta hydrolase [Verrucomicrobiales bacterium]
MTSFAERRWKSTDGLSLFARDYPGVGGEARLPVICLHGLTRNSSDFETLAPFIASLGRRVIVPDVRGRGLSQWDANHDRYVPQTYAKDVKELLDALGIAKAVFLGTSMGGIIMMMLAARQRGRISAVVLNDVGPKVSPEGIARIQSYAGKPVELNCWADAVAYVRRINKDALPNLGDEDWERLTKRTFERADSGPILKYDAGISTQLNAGRAKFPSFMAWMLYRRLTAKRKTLILRGETSDILSRETAKRMVAEATTARLVEVPGVGHAPLLDEPTSEAALLSFLEEVA